MFSQLSFEDDYEAPNPAPTRETPNPEIPVEVEERWNLAEQEYRAKRPASADKIRGGYYTPAPIATFLAGWVSQSGERLLEPSCGDGRILGELARRSSHAFGVELIASEAQKASRFARVAEASLFEWMHATDLGAWDGVAGNPPYIRFGNWPILQREPALNLMRRHGLNPTKLTNAWVPFVVAATLLARVGGRVALVLPGELLQVGYAEQLREFLLSHFSEITIITFERLVFEGVLQEVVLFLGVRGAGPALIRTVHLEDLQSLDNAHIDGSYAPALLHEEEKWTKYFLHLDEIALLRSLRTSSDLIRLGSVASIDVGVVTGRNSFFTFTDREIAQNGLSAYSIPLVSRSSQLLGLVYDRDTRAKDLMDGHRTWLLNAPDQTDDPVLVAYLRRGQQAGVDRGYKCSIRKPWWRMPSAWVPDAFMLRQIHNSPRITVNDVGATSTDTVHRIRVDEHVGPRLLGCAFHNSVTFAFCEIMGRSYGGGILELEPREAERLPIPSPSLASDGLVDVVDALLKGNEVDKALTLVDEEVLVAGLGMSRRSVELCNGAWKTLRDRRLRRGGPR